MYKFCNKRWHLDSMISLGLWLFKRIERSLRLAHHNHEIFFLARDQLSWLSAGVKSLITGNYDPQHIRRYYFPEEIVDSLHIIDRILQNMLLRQLKSTFKKIIHPNCLHLNGPQGVKLATKIITQATAKTNPKYVIRIDIKSYYSSIIHYKLIQDLKKIFADPKVIRMLTNIIKNPIETRYGCINPDLGIPIRGPLSGLFGAIYLKPLDDAFSNMDVTYVRYNDDILILCKTKRQLNRAWQKMQQVLQERQLSLARKKSRKGSIQNGFHFLGIEYLGARTQDDNNGVVPQTLKELGEGNSTMRMLLHRRTIRKARLQVKDMVANGFSALEIRNYLRRWVGWWQSCCIGVMEKGRSTTNENCH